MVAIINYGGRVTDDRDNRLIESILNDFIKPEIFEPDYKSLFALPESYELDSMCNLIHNMPVDDVPEYFGLHINSQIMYKQMQTK